MRAAGRTVNERALPAADEMMQRLDQQSKMPGMDQTRLAMRIWRRKVTVSLVPVLVLMLGSCGGGSGDGLVGPTSTACTASAKKSFILNTAQQWYLFPDLLPASIDPAAYTTADNLLAALTAGARAQSKDRNFSFTTTISAETAILSGGTTIAFGLSLRTVSNNTRIIVGQVFEGSNAAAAGFLRGDEILALGDSAGNLQSASAILASTDGLTAALGPATTGLTRVFRVLTAAGVTVDRSVAKAEFSLNPVNIVRIIDRPGLTPIGYLSIRTFVSTADGQLRAAFASFKNSGVRDVILDMRYNGGGLITTAELLTNLFAGDRTGQVSYSVRFNPSKASSETTSQFALQPQTVGALRIAFIATDATASASELIINALAPYANVAIVGGRTYGKPVGQNAYDITSCDFRLRLVAFRLVNRNNQGDYYGGLPDATFSGAFCASTDDFSKPIGADTDAMTSDAQYWLNNNRCRVQGASALRQQARQFTDATTPALTGPVDPLQVYVPGTY